MDVTIHNPKRTECKTLKVDYTAREPGHVGVIELECEFGGKVRVIFESPDDIREQAAALTRLADLLEGEKAE